MERIHNKIRSLKGLQLDEEAELNSSGYNLMSDIGSGTFGQVKLATHIDTGLPVAIKVLNKSEIEQNDDFERVSREFDILVKINHPNIIYLYEIIEEEEFYFLVTEFCPDGDLETLLKEKGRFSEKVALEYLAQLVSAVAYLHSQGIVHRDIKPENILLSGNRIKVIDFGLSNLYNPRDRLKTPCGSPCFAPPEMVCGYDYDPVKSDVWSIGISLYYMVVGSLPFIDKELKTLYQKIVEGTIEYPNFLSDQMKQLLKSMLSQDPRQRPSLNALTSHPLLPKIRKPLSPPGDLHEGVLRGVAKCCSVPETLLREFLTSGNKNAFTAQYYLEIHSMTKKMEEAYIMEEERLMKCKEKKQMSTTDGFPQTEKQTTQDLVNSKLKLRPGEGHPTDHLRDGNNFSTKSPPARTASLHSYQDDSPDQVIQTLDESSIDRKSDRKIETSKNAANAPSRRPPSLERDKIEAKVDQTKEAQGKLITINKDFDSSIFYSNSDEKHNLERLGSTSSQKLKLAGSQPQNGKTLTDGSKSRAEETLEGGAIKSKCSASKSKPKPLQLGKEIVVEPTKHSPGIFAIPYSQIVVPGKKNRKKTLPRTQRSSDGSSSGQGGLNFLPGEVSRNSMGQTISFGSARLAGTNSKSPQHTTLKNPFSKQATSGSPPTKFAIPLETRLTEKRFNMFAPFTNRLSRSPTALTGNHGLGRKIDISNIFPHTTTGFHQNLSQSRGSSKGQKRVEKPRVNVSKITINFSNVLPTQQIAVPTMGSPVSARLMSNSPTTVVQTQAMTGTTKLVSPRMTSRSPPGSSTKHVQHSGFFTANQGSPRELTPIGSPNLFQAKSRAKDVSRDANPSSNGSARQIAEPWTKRLKFSSGVTDTPGRSKPLSARSTTTDKGSTCTSPGTGKLAGEPNEYLRAGDTSRQQPPRKTQKPKLQNKVSQILKNIVKK